VLDSRRQRPNPEKLIGRPFVLGFLAPTNFPSSHRNPESTKTHSSISCYNSFLLHQQNVIVIFSDVLISTITGSICIDLVARVFFFFFLIFTFRKYKRSFLKFCFSFVIALNLINKPCAKIHCRMFCISYYYNYYNKLLKVIQFNKKLGILEKIERGGFALVHYV